MSENLAFLEKIKNLSQSPCLPLKSELLSVLKETADCLSHESADYRPYIQGTDMCGGLLDFTAQDQKPLIVVPDLHARADFIKKILDFKFPNTAMLLESSSKNNSSTVFSLLEQEKVRIVFLGDIMHGERRAMERWLLAYKDFENGNFTGPFMCQEMAEGLSTLLCVCYLKLQFPKLVHCLKGNHENIRNEEGGGNFPFRKFVLEGEMVTRFMVKKYDKIVLNAIHNVELLLPIVAIFKNCILSHGEPRRAMSREELINAPMYDNVVYNLTWTANDEAELGGVEKMLKSLLPKNKTRSVYIGGHRPVKGKYALRQNGLYVQIHNPQEENIALVLPNKDFDPENDIYSVEE